MMLQVNLGISKKTLYQFVTDKDDLVGKFIDNEIESTTEGDIASVSRLDSMQLKNYLRFRFS